MQEPSEGPVPTFGELLKHFGVEDRPSKKNITFTDPDLTYLVQRTGFEPRFIAQQLRRYGPLVVKESLRRAVEASIHSEKYFVGMCKNVSAE